MKKELNIDDYFALKEKRYTDAAIMAFFGVTRWAFDRWKKENGLKGYRLTARRNHKLEQKKQQFLDLYNAGLCHEAIAGEMNLSSTQLGEFKTDHFPELKRKSPRHFTKEELAIMHEKGLTRTAMTERLKKMPFEEAIKIPPKDPKFSFTSSQKNALKRLPVSRSTVRSRMIRGMTFSEAISAPLRARKRHEGKGAIG